MAQGGAKMAVWRAKMAHQGAKMGIWRPLDALSGTFLEVLGAIFAEKPEV